MAIDHGLGGKDTEESRRRRERKAKRTKALLKKLKDSNENISRKHNEIKFDENSRVAFLTGFRKRKQERRKYGLAMELLKSQKQRKEASKERLKILEDNSANGRDHYENDSDPNSEEDGDEKEEEEEEEEEEKDDNASIFNDSATVSMFGSAVSVVVDTSPHLVNDAFEEETDEVSDNASIASFRSSSVSSLKIKGKKEKSRFEKAMQKAKETMGLRKKKSTLHQRKNVRSSIKTKIESSKLLEKAFGRKMGKKHKR